MKRQTKAEEALKTQFDNIKEEIRILQNEISHREAKIVALTSVGDDLYHTIERLKADRSKPRKPVLS